MRTGSIGITAILIFSFVAGGVEAASVVVSLTSGVASQMFGSDGRVEMLVIEERQ